jgi:choline dehydrogenase
MTQARYDFVIVGGGSAGCALANRLSADPSARVLVLEAGRPDYRWDVFIHMPAALAFPIGSRFYDWRYSSEPEPSLNGRRVYHARGKVLGGSSSINGMIFQRGNPLDYERWAADPGMADWDYAHCLPYFKRMETCLAGADEYRGGEGPLVLERGPASSPLFGAFFEAVQQAGYPLTSDVNGYRQEGFAAFDRNVHRGRRLSAARAYLHPVMGRPNLEVVCRALVTRILFEGTRATGVEYTRGSGTAQQVRAGEVIVCGGAINTPQLLQLSGVGNAADLAALGIDVVADLPGLGENLQDHLEVYVQYAAKLPVSVAPALKWRNRPMVGARWLLARSGPGATNHFEAGGFVRSNDDVAYPNLMFHFLPIAIRYDGSAPGRRARLPGTHRPDVLGLPRLCEDHFTGSHGAPGTAVQLPVHPDRPAGVGGGHSDRPAHPGPARVRALQRRRAVTGAGGAHRRAGAGLGAPRRGDRAAPLLHGEDGRRRRHRRGPGEHAGARAGRAAGGRRLGDAVCHQRQHLRPGDDDRGEGGRPDPGPHAAPGGAGRVLPAWRQPGSRATPRGHMRVLLTSGSRRGRW